MNSWMQEVEGLLSQYPSTVSTLTLLMTSLASIVALRVAWGARRLQEVRLRASCGFRNVVRVGDSTTSFAQGGEHASKPAIVTVVNAGHIDTRLDLLSFEIAEFASSQYRLLIPPEDSRHEFPVDLARGRKFAVEVFDEEAIKKFSRDSSVWIFRTLRLQLVQFYVREPTGRRFRVRVERELRTQINKWVKSA